MRVTRLGPGGSIRIVHVVLCVAAALGAFRAARALPVPYSNSYDVARDDEVVVRLASSGQDADAYVITQLPRHGELMSRFLRRPISSAPTKVSGDSLIYRPRPGFVGADHFEFEPQRSGTSAIPARIRLSVVEFADKPGRPGSFMWKVPPIESDRAPQPLAPERPVSKADYLSAIDAYWDNQAIHAHRIAGNPDSPYQDQFALFETFLFRVHRETNAGRARSHLRWAMKLLRGSGGYYFGDPGNPGDRGHAPTNDSLQLALEIELLLRGSPELGEEDGVFVRDYVMGIEAGVRAIYEKNGYEYGAIARSVRVASNFAVFSVLHPDAPGAHERQTYSDAIWQAWFPQREFQPNSSQYGAMTLGNLLRWIDATQRRDLYHDPGFTALLERHFQWVAPLGIAPSVGQGTGLNANPGLWIALLEKYASERRDGRWRWLAHRMFRWVQPRGEEMSEWGNITGSAMRHLIRAYLDADESIEPVEPRLASVATRTRAIWTASRSSGQVQSAWGVTDEGTWDKLVLRSGADREDLFALVELSPVRGHAHCDLGGISLLTHAGSVLLSNPPYLLTSPVFHNVFQLQIPTERNCLNGDEGRSPYRDVRAELEVLEDGEFATFAQVRIPNYLAQPAELVRRIFFVKDRFVWVHDRLEVSGRIPFAAVGPAWHTGAIYGASGSNWFNTAFNTVPVADIWGLFYLMQWRNPAWDLLILFPEVPDGSPPLPATVDYVGRDDSRGVVGRTLQNSARYRIWRRQEGDLRAGEVVHSSSVLAPHSPEPDSRALVGRFSLLVDEPDAAVLRYEPTPGHEIWLGFSERPEPLRVGPLVSDAPFFVVERRHGETLEPLAGDGGEPAFVAEYCGDAVIQTGEACDDANFVTDACRYGEPECRVCNSSCQWEEGAPVFCGNGRLEAAYGETCDGDDFGPLACRDFGLVAGELGCSQCRVDSRDCRLACAPRPLGLVAWWPGDGTGQEWSGGPPAVPRAGAGFAEDGQRHGFALDGGEARVDVDGFAVASREGTISLWLKPAVALEKDVSYTLLDTGNVPFWLRRNEDGELEFVWVYDAGRKVRAALPASDLLGPERWTHVVVRWNVEQLLENGHDLDLRVDYEHSARFFLDRSSDQRAIRHYPKAPLRLGREVEVPGRELITRAFHGVIGDVAVFDRALSDAEIRDLFNAGALGMCRGVGGS